MPEDQVMARRTIAGAQAEKSLAEQYREEVVELYHVLEDDERTTDRRTPWADLAENEPNLTLGLCP